MPRRSRRFSRYGQTVAGCVITPHPVQEFSHLTELVSGLGLTAVTPKLAARLAVLVAGILTGTASAGALAAFVVSDPAVAAGSQVATPAIVIGFVGGFVRRDDPHHGPVQLAQRIQRSVPKSTHVEVFENRHRAQARAAILRLLDTNHDGILSDEEKSRARIVLYGHSWGAQAAVLLARELRRDHIPVLLTVQVDSVAKPWRNDSVIPDNVAEAANFYQPHGLLHGRALITAADQSKTEILGNYRTDYRKDPIPCPEASWAGRFFTPGHTQSECDPRVWSYIEALVRARIAPQDLASASNSAPNEMPDTANRK
jgi:pimeloyl-ACP methyl ester carboxylesterase